MTSKRIAQTNQQRNSEASQESGILQRAAVRSVSEAGVESTDDQQAQPLGNSALSKDFSRVPISTTKPQQIMAKQMVSPVMQRVNAPASARLSESETVQREEMSEASRVQKENKTGLPDNLKSGIENLSGISMDDVKVQYNSPKPAQLQALAYTQGTDIHVAPGQKKHLAHEAWHVVQQKQGRVKPTVLMKGKVNINDDACLEKEADVMGAKASRYRGGEGKTRTSVASPKSGTSDGGSIQRKEVSDLVTELNKVMDDGPLKKAQIIAGLKKLAKEDLNDTNFARALVEFVKGRNNSDFKITDLEEAPKVTLTAKQHLKKKWTFRHYTNEKHDTLKSLASLEAQGVNASANTNAKDWEQLGNQGYIFGLVSIDGKVPQRPWLSKMKYYAEYDIEDLTSIWVSGDMLDDQGRKQASFQGTGTNVIAQLSQMLGFINQNEANSLDQQFASKLEAKVPPGVLSKPVWKET